MIFLNKNSYQQKTFKTNINQANRTFLMKV
jgi:hypothetical protein